MMFWTGDDDSLLQQSVFICADHQNAELQDCVSKYWPCALILSLSFPGTPFTDAREALGVAEEQAAAADSQCSRRGKAPSWDGWADKLPKTRC